MLDNTASAEQVRPLLPGNGSCAVVVTSRDSLAGLVAVHGAHRIDLELLPRAEAVTLLRRLIGPRAIYPGPNVAAFVSGPWDMPTAILSTGCVLDPDTSAGEADENGRHFLSAEQLNLLDAPMVVLLQSDAVEGERAAADEIAADSLWEGLPAVQAGLVFEFDRLGYPGIEGQIRFLQEIAALGG